jgi:hypothetical protein
MFLRKKLDILFLLCIFEKEASKKEKIVKVLKPQKLKKLKNIGSDITNQRHISFLCLDNETVETRYQLMVGFKVVSYFKLIILCWIFYLFSKDYQGWFLLNTKAGHSFLFEGINVWISQQREEKLFTSINYVCSCSGHLA